MRIERDTFTERSAEIELKRALWVMQRMNETTVNNEKHRKFVKILRNYITQLREVAQ